MKNLSDEQIEILYINYLNLPNDEFLKDSYCKRESKMNKANELREALKKQGKPEFLIDKIVEEYLQNECS